MWANSPKLRTDSTSMLPQWWRVNFFFYMSKCAVWIRKPPQARSTDSPPSPPASIVKTCDTQAFLLIPLICTAIIIIIIIICAPCQLLCFSDSRRVGEAGVTCQQLGVHKKRLAVPLCVHRRTSLNKTDAVLEYSKVQDERPIRNTRLRSCIQADSHPNDRV